MTEYWTVIALIFTYIGTSMASYTFATSRRKIERRLPFFAALLLVMAFAVSELGIVTVPYSLSIGITLSIFLGVLMKNNV